MSLETGDVVPSTRTYKTGFYLCNGQVFNNADAPDLASHMATFGSEYVVSETQTKVFDLTGLPIGGALPGDLGTVVGDGIVTINHLPLLPDALGAVSILTSNTQSLDGAINGNGFITCNQEPLPQDEIKPRYNAVNWFIKI